MSFPQGSAGFLNPVIGGDGELVIGSVHSRGYVPGVSGWSINRNGTAEFSNVDVRGTVEARNGHAFIRLDPTQPDMEFSPNDLTFTNGFFQFIDTGSGGITLLQGTAKPGQGVPIIQLQSDGTANGQLVVDATTETNNATLLDMPNGTIRVFEGPVTVTNGLGNQTTWGSQYKEKPFFTDYTSNNTLTDDPDLFFELETNSTYVFEFYLICTSPTNTPDLKMDFTVPTGATLDWVPNALDPSVALNTVQGIVRLPNNRVGDNRAIAAVGTGTSAVVAWGRGRVKTAGTQDKLRLRMCQNTLTAEATRVLERSWMICERKV